jgi:hypothetical protein
LPRPECCQLVSLPHGGCYRRWGGIGAGNGETLEARPRRDHRRYGAQIRNAPIALWDASDRVCSKRLAPLVPVLLPALGRHGRLTVNEATTGVLLPISPATRDRLLADVRLAGHAGTSTTGSFIQTMRLTDIATAWTECLPVVMRAGELVIEARSAALALFPVHLRGVDVDNDGAFMNELMVPRTRTGGDALACRSHE